ncbi:hypothetical protein ACFV0H_41405 [Streptomyces erythrochromogenes]|uniref:hypothetical protein n=1 Tax=Streptomyces erythrochromogenes TaxID=285574 RepID=UPI0036A1CC05
MTSDKNFSDGRIDLGKCYVLYSSSTPGGVANRILTNNNSNLKVTVYAGSKADAQGEYCGNSASEELVVGLGSGEKIFSTPYSHFGIRFTQPEFDDGSVIRNLDSQGQSRGCLANSTQLEDCNSEDWRQRWDYSSYKMQQTGPDGRKYCLTQDQLAGKVAMRPCGASPNLEEWNTLPVASGGEGVRLRNRISANSGGWWELNVQPSGQVALTRDRGDAWTGVAH